jgi:LDH2 family malate/lactate/ureidoglycolate dehydrogenase
VRATGRDRTGVLPDHRPGTVAGCGGTPGRAARGGHRALRGLGFDDRTGRLIGDHYLDAELRGARTHGLERLRWLAGRVDLDPLARPALVRRADGLATWDAAGAVGYVALADALDAECRVALTGGRLVVVEDCFPTGRLGWFAERTAARGLVCLLTATSPARITHPDGGPPALATSPLCLAVPGTPPAVVDVSMGRMTFGDVLASAAAGERLPEGAGVRPDGSPEDDPAEIAAGRAGIRPFGGDQAHKGFALAALVELLAGAVSRSSGFAAVALLAAPAADAAARVRSLVDGRRFPGDASRARAEAARARGSVEISDDVWEWVRR